MSKTDNDLRSIRPTEHRPRPPEPMPSDVVPIVRQFQFAAIDRGFGLDADAMIERSQRLHAHHRGKVPTPTAHEPVVLNATPTLGGLAKPAPTAFERAQVTAKSTATQFTTQSQNPTPPVQAQFVSPMQRDGAHAPALQPTQPATAGVHFQPLPPPTETQLATETRVSGARAFCAFIADLCIPVSILVSFFVTQSTWQEGFQQALARVAARSQTWETIERTYLLFPWLLPIVATIVLTFVTQYFCGMLGHNSFGRSLCVMSLKKANSIAHIFLLALFEAVTFGGLLTLPLLFLMPSRLPLFPWVQFRIR